MASPRPLSVAAACGRLLAALAAAGILAGGLAWFVGGWSRVAALAVAEGMCAVGGVAALAASGWYRGPQRALFVMVVGALLRGVGPLIGGLVLQENVAWLAEAGVALWVLGFYLFTLFIEAWLLPGLLASTSGIERQPGIDQQGATEPNTR